MRVSTSIAQKKRITSISPGCEVGDFSPLLGGSSMYTLGLVSGGRYQSLSTGNHICMQHGTRATNTPLTQSAEVPEGWETVSICVTPCLFLPLGK